MLGNEWSAFPTGAPDFTNIKISGARCRRDLWACLAGDCVFFGLTRSPNSAACRSVKRCADLQYCAVSATVPYTPWTRRQQSSRASDRGIRGFDEGPRFPVIWSLRSRDRRSRGCTSRRCSPTLYEWMALGKSTALIRRNWTSAFSLCAIAPEIPEQHCFSPELWIALIFLEAYRRRAQIAHVYIALFAFKDSVWYIAAR